MDKPTQQNMAWMSGFSHCNGSFLEPDWRGRRSPVTRRIQGLAAGAALAFTGSVLAATPKPEAPPAKHPTAQQQRMADCNKHATGKKGPERKAFMSSCLKKKGNATTPAMP